MNHLQNTVALVTGSSRGIGAAIARGLARQGAKVVVNYTRSESQAQALVAEINAAGGEAIAVQGDVAQPEAGAALVQTTLDRFGKLDLLVNNAGVFHDDSSVRPNFEVNVLGLLSVTSAALPHLKSGATIINISSLVGRDPVPGYAAYSGSKAAVDAITKAYARQLGPQGVRVNAVAPGFTETDMTAAGGPEFRAYAVAATAMGRAGTAEEVADAVVFLASPQAGWVTGEILGVGGGIRL